MVPNSRDNFCYVHSHANQWVVAIVHILYTVYMFVNEYAFRSGTFA